MRTCGCQWDRAFEIYTPALPSWLCSCAADTGVSILNFSILTFLVWNLNPCMAWLPPLDFASTLLDIFLSPEEKGSQVTTQHWPQSEPGQSFLS